jgi:tripartite-type tricarboxylate transporter receptor subunit TctC
MRRLRLVVAAFLTVLSASAAADNWPSRPVRILAPATAGGAADTLARLIAEPMSEKYGQRFYIENRPGGGGLIADVATARAEPDGYTLMISSVAYHVVSPAMSANPGIDPVKDFTHIAYIGGPPNVFIANPVLGVRSMAELVALARRAPEPIAFVSPGTGTMGHLLAEAFAREAGIKLQHIPH